LWGFLLITMATGKKSVLLYCDLIHTIEKMDDENAGKLFKHYLRYVNDLEPVAENILIEIAFEPIRQQLKRDLQKWDEQREKRSIAGKISAEKRSQQNQQVLTHVESVQHKPTNSTVNDTVTVTVNVTDTVNDILLEKETKDISEVKKSKRFIPPTTKEVFEYCQIRKNNVDPQRFIDFYTSNGWHVGKNKMKDWKAAVRTWEKNNFNTNNNGTTTQPRRTLDDQVNDLTARVFGINPEQSTGTTNSGSGIEEADWSVLE